MHRRVRSELMKHHDPDRFLIVTADDFGLHDSVNEAVERAHLNGVLTAASLMVGESAAADAVRRALTLPTLRVGLHLVLADGRSTLAPHLIPAMSNADGRMDADLVSRSVRFFAIPSVRMQMEEEIRAQFEAFAATGLILDHVNVHKHFHLHPSILSAVLKVGRDFNVRAIRLPAEPVEFAFESGWVAGTSALLLKPWVALMRRRLRAARIHCNDYLFGVASTGALDRSKLLDALAVLRPGVTEIYSHPALANAMTLGTPAGSQHEKEFHALINLRVKSVLSKRGIPTGGYSDAFSHSCPAP